MEEQLTSAAARSPSRRVLPSALLVREAHDTSRSVKPPLLPPVTLPAPPLRFPFHPTCPLRSAIAIFVPPMIGSCFWPGGVRACPPRIPGRPDATPPGYS